MKILIQTQYEENYGTHDWDGTGVCPQYWKMKGGSEFTIEIGMEDAAKLGGSGLREFVAKIGSESINQDNNYCRQYIIDWELLDTGELTHGEKQGLEYGYANPPIILAPFKTI